MSSFSNLSVTSPKSQLILQPFRRFTYVTSSFSNPSVASPTSQLILQPLFRFSYVTGSSPGEPPGILKSWLSVSSSSDAVTSEEEDTNSQDFNVGLPTDHGDLARNYLMKLITPAVKALLISVKKMSHFT